MPAGAKEAKASRQEAAQTRALEVAKDSCLKRGQEGLELLKADCEALTRALDSQLTEVRQRGQSASNPLRYKLWQFAAALAVAALAIPFVLEEDVEQWMVQLWVGIALGLAAIMVVSGLLVPAPTQLDSRFEQQVAAMEEQERFLHLVARQRALWCGEPLASTSMSQSLQQESTSTRRSVPSQAAPKSKEGNFSI